MVRRGITVEKAKKIRERQGLESTKLQRLRVEKGLSQSELAEKSGVTLRSIQCYEQGYRPIENARIESLFDLCVVLNCKLEDIIDNTRLIEKYNRVK